MSQESNIPADSSNHVDQAQQLEGEVSSGSDQPAAIDPGTEAAQAELTGAEVGQADVERADVEAQQPRDEIGSAAEDSPSASAGDGLNPEDAEPAADPVWTAEDDEEDEEDDGPVEPLELIEEADQEEVETSWYILKVQVNRESSICDALQRRVKVAGLEHYFGEILVPTEDVREFTKSGKQRIVKRKLYPGYIVVNMAINDDTWFLVRETPGIGDFTGSAGKPTPLETKEVDRIVRATKRIEGEEEATGIKTAIKFKPGDRVRVKEGYFQNFEGDVEAVDESNGRITVMINIFGRPTPVELDHWQVEDV